MRLIDGDGLWERLNYEPWEHNADRDEIALPIVNAAPTVDAVPVVRCKDCKYGDYDSKLDGAMVCLRTNDGFWRKETDFCSYGEYQTNTGGVTHDSIH